MSATFNEDAIKAAWDPNTPKEIKPGYVYAASKAEGERAAWKWVEEHKPGYTFNTVLPNFNVRSRTIITRGVVSSKLTYVSS